MSKSGLGSVFFRKNGPKEHVKAVMFSSGRSRTCGVAPVEILCSTWMTPTIARPPLLFVRSGLAYMCGRPILCCCMFWAVRVLWCVDRNRQATDQLLEPHVCCDVSVSPQDKFVPTNSMRLEAYIRLGLVSKSELDRALDKHLPTTAVPATTATVLQHPQEAAPSGSSVATAVPVVL